MRLPPYDKFPEITYDAIVLRQVQMEDINDLIEISFYDALPALTVDDAIQMQTKINMDYQNGSSIHWAIAERHTNKVIGSLGYYRGFDQAIGELGCVLKTEFQGYGFMTTAMRLAIEFGLNDIGLIKIKAITAKQNDNAIKLLNRLNFIKTLELQNDEIEYLFVNPNLKL